jgi:hypothetical protein
MIDVECAEDHDEPREGCERRDRLQPIIVEVEEHHLRFSGFEDEVTELLDLEAGLEGEAELTSLNHDVGEIQ